jgi:hypothetical protein
MGIFDKGVKKTNRSFFDRLSRAVVGRTEVDDDVLDAIEEALVATDMGVDTAMKVIENLEERVRRDKYVSMNELADMIREEIGDLMNVGDGEEVVPFDFSKKPYIIMVVGVMFTPIFERGTDMRVRKQPVGTRNICGAKVEQRRKDIGMKQKDLLTQLQIRGVDLNASGLSKLEGQVRSVCDTELIALSEVLGVSVNWLLGLE